MLVSETPSPLIRFARRQAIATACPTTRVHPWGKKIPSRAVGLIISSCYAFLSLFCMFINKMLMLALWRKHTRCSTGFVYWSYLAYRLRSPRARKERKICIITRPSRGTLRRATSAFDRPNFNARPRGNRVSSATFFRANEIKHVVCRFWFSFCNANGEALCISLRKTHDWVFVTPKM